MSSNDTSVNLRIGGDVAGLSSALGVAEQDLLELSATALKVKVLEGAEQSARDLAGEIERTRQKVQALQTTLSEAYGSGADNQLIASLGRQLATAEREAGRAQAAFDKNTQALAKMRREAREAGVDVTNLAAEGIRLNQAANAASALSAAFRTLGVKPLQEVRAETERLQSALRVIRESGVIGPDQERAVEAFKVRLAQLRGEVGQMPGPAAAAKHSLAGLTGEANSMSAALGNAAHKAVAWAGALTGLGGVSDLARNVIQTGAAFETLEARLSSLLGSTEAAQEAMGQIKELAITTPFEVSALADSFTKLTAFGLQPSMVQMRALADTAATLGGGTEALTGVTTALGQSWAKGKLQGEEIMQLAERGVPVWDMLAEATGKNTAELQNMAASGELGRSTILKLIDAMGQMNAGASEKLMATFSGAVSNAKDALAEFYDMIAKAGVLDFLTGQIQDLLAEFDRMKQSGELQETAQKIADGFVAVGEGVRMAIESVKAFSGVIKLSVEVFAAYKVAGMSVPPMLAGVGAAAGAATVQVSRLAADMLVAAGEAKILGTSAGVATVELKTLGGAAGTAAQGVGLLANGMRLLKGLAVVGLIEGVISLGAEFLRARKAAEDADRVFRKLAEPTPVNGPKEAIKAVATETEAARFKLTEYQAALGEMQAQGKATGEALAEMVKKADLGTVKGVEEMLSGLESVRRGAMATGEQIQQSIQDRLSKMAAGELREFGIMAESAFNRGTISAEQLASTLNLQVDVALKKLGSSAEVSAGGMTAKFIEVAQQIGVVESSFDRLKESGQNASAILKSAFEGGLNVAKSVQDLEGLAVSIRQAGEAGRLSKRDVEDFLDTIRAKVEALTPGVNSLAEAFRALGMKTPEELKKVASAAEEAFLVIKQQSGFTKGELANVSEAFRRYAEASIAANGGVASDTLRVKASFYGLTIETDKAGKSIVVAAEKAGEAGDSFVTLADQTDTLSESASKAADSYDQMAASIDSAAKSSRQAASSTRATGTTSAAAPANSGGSPLAKHWTSPDGRNIVFFDPRAEAFRAGATKDNISEAEQQIELEIERLKALSNGRGLTLGQFQSAVAKVMRDLAAGGSAASPAGSSTLSERAAPQTITVNLNGRSTAINLASGADAKQLVSLFQQLESDSARAY